MIRRSMLPIVVALSALALSLPAAASAKTVTARGDGITAALSYQGKLPNFSDVALSITRGSRSLYRGAVTYKSCGHDCWPVSGNAHQAAVQIGDYQNDGAADVLLNLYSGGAHCCSIAEVFSPSAAMGGRYVLAAAHDFGDPGYRVRVLGAKRSFVTADDSFAYAFTDFADSGLPLQILQISNGRFADVTRSFPGLVRADAARWLTAYRKARGRNDVGLIAAWAADECTLGRSSSAFSYLAAQQQAGRLNSGFGAKYSGARFVASLRTLLRRDGYLS